MFPLFVPIKKPEKTEKTMKMSRSQCLMGFAMKHFSDASGWTHQILRSASPWAFPSFFLDKIEKAYNMDPPLAFHQKRKFPFRYICCLLSRVGPLLGVATSTTFGIISRRRRLGGTLWRY